MALIIAQAGNKKGSSEEIVGGFRFGQLAKFEAAREDESAT
jgi:hypothetical protein